MKVDKVEPFSIDRLTTDFAEGSLEAAMARPDFGAAHEPHVDLTVRPVGGETLKYRVYDTTGASNVLQDFGPDGITLRR